MLNDARVASRGFVKDNICTTRIHKEKKFKIKFKVLLKFTQILPDYFFAVYACLIEKIFVFKGIPKERQFKERQINKILSHALLFIKSEVNLNTGA